MLWYISLKFFKFPLKLLKYLDTKLRHFKIKNFPFVLIDELEINSYRVSIANTFNRPL